MKKLFGELKMRWLTVLLFAVAAGVYTGAVMLIPALDGTSFQDIGVSFEWWVVFAVVIVTNCSRSLEAAAKCFVFFLVSQPLVYLTEVVFGDLTLEMAKYYYFSNWLPVTFLTLPGGFIAYFAKKQNALGGYVLGVGNGIELALCVYYLKAAAAHFPRHLLSGIFCLAFIFVMTFGVQREKNNRVIALIVPVILNVLLLIFGRVTGWSLF